jgi:hypothetical protein
MASVINGDVGEVILLCDSHVFLAIAFASDKHGCSSYSERVWSGVKQQ